MLLKIILVSTLAGIVLSTPNPGSSVICNSEGDCTKCGTSNLSTWVQGDSSKTCKIADCSVVTLPLSNVFDTGCQSCLGSNQFAQPDQTGCLKNTPSKGNAVQCQSANSSCQTCGSLPSAAFSWIPQPSSSQNCIVSSCLAAPYSSGVTDAFCISCGKSNNLFANSAGTACVASTDSCLRSKNWSDRDCQICNGTDPQSKQVASSDKTQCLVKAKSGILQFFFLLASILMMI